MMILDWVVSNWILPDYQLTHRTSNCVRVTAASLSSGIFVFAGNLQILSLLGISRFLYLLGISRFLSLQGISSFSGRWPIVSNQSTNPLATQRE